MPPCQEESCQSFALFITSSPSHPFSQNPLFHHSSIPVFQLWAKRAKFSKQSVRSGQKYKILQLNIMNLPMSDVKIVVMNTYWSLLKRSENPAWRDKRRHFCPSCHQKRVVEFPPASEFRFPNSGIPENRKLAWARAMAGRWAVALPGNKRGFPSRVGRYSWIPLIARSGSSTWWEFFSLWRGSKGLREDFELQWMKHMLLSWDPVRWGGFRWCHKGGDDQTGH